MQVYTHYENYQGGINNLQISSVINGYVKALLSQHIQKLKNI
jgi:hypothetical protein